MKCLISFGGPFTNNQNKRVSVDIYKKLKGYKP